MEAHTLEVLEKNIKHIIDEILKEKRHYINKHIQNALNNYFMENYCVLSLKKRFRLQSGRQIKNLIITKYQTEGAAFPLINITFSGKQHTELKKYYLLLLGFLEEHIANDSLQEYRSAMLSIINTSELETPCPNDKEGVKQWSISQWKKLIALFVLHHSYFPQLEAIYTIWFDIFQSPIIAASAQKKKQVLVQRKNKYEDLPYVIKGEDSREEFSVQILNIKPKQIESAETLKSPVIDTHVNSRSSGVKDMNSASSASPFKLCFSFTGDGNEMEENIQQNESNQEDCEKKEKTQKAAIQNRIECVSTKKQFCNSSKSAFQKFKPTSSLLPHPQNASEKLLPPKEHLNQKENMISRNPSILLSSQYQSQANSILNNPQTMSIFQFPTHLIAPQQLLYLIPSHPLQYV